VLSVSGLFLLFVLYIGLSWRTLGEWDDVRLALYQDAIARPGEDSFLQDCLL
jgi:hypothetical protein